MPIALPVDASIAVPKDAYGSELSSERDFSKPRMVVLAGDCCVVYLYWGGGRKGGDSNLFLDLLIRFSQARMHLDKEEHHLCLLAQTKRRAVLHEYTHSDRYVHLCVFRRQQSRGWGVERGADISYLKYLRHGHKNEA